MRVYLPLRAVVSRRAAVSLSIRPFISEHPLWSLDSPPLAEANLKGAFSTAMAKRKRVVPEERGHTAVAIIRETEVAVRDPSGTTPRKRRSANEQPKNKAVDAESRFSNAEESISNVADESPLTELESETCKAETTVKRRRGKKDAEPVVYDIPPVERKTTNFKGRLGYACLNTILRARKPASESVFCSRTCRLDTIRKNGLDFAKELGRQNCKDLLTIIQWNEDNRVRFFRLSSEMFPFASHGTYGYSLEYAAEELKAAGDLAKRYGHRLTSHPGQFTQLASPKDDVVTASVRELDYHCQLMRYMGLDQDSVIIIHMGGVYGNKPGTLERFRENYRTRLTDEMRARLVLENDEICYSADDLLPVCEELGVPLVFDYHHDWINPSMHPLPELLPRIAATWTQKGIRPKQHLSSPRPGAESVMEKRAHADRCHELPVDLPEDMDLMIEAKDKEQAVFHLYRIYDLEPVIHENLRPEKPPRPFVRGKNRSEDQAEEEDGMEGDGEASIAIMRTRSGSKGKRDLDDSDAVKDEDITNGTDTSKLAKASPRKRRTGAEISVTGNPSTDLQLAISKRTKKASGMGEENSGENNDTETTPRGTKVTKQRKHSKKEKVALPLNQEESVEPVDGAPVEVVEADEHPEAAGNAETVKQEAQQCKDGQSVRKKKRKRKITQSSTENAQA
ncbi:hypothetical protein AcW1_002653 [Taiwanofungus camphoratus]|nr:hypothetical protein AcW1_002653 [Antrodia cinnamomea]